eukprot:333131-Chlamydomonas_euryale.AAC.1
MSAEQHDRQHGPSPSLSHSLTLSLSHSLTLTADRARGGGLSPAVSPLLPLRLASTPPRIDSVSHQLRLASTPSRINSVS